MKKALWFVGAVIALGVLGFYAIALGAANPAALGGTGTSVVPTNGQVLIGNGAGSYTPALITPGTDIIITNASGSVTLAVKTSDFLPSSTVYVATVNGQSGAITITSSTLGVATNTLSLFNGNGFTTTTIQSVLNALSASGLASYNSSTGAFSVSSSSLNLKSASQYNFSDFLPSSTVYVATVNGQSGAVTISVPATTTVNGVQASGFKVIGDGTTVTSTVNGSTTTFSLINTGNWAGTWQGVNSSTFYLASNPSGFISSAPATTTINQALGPFFNFVASSTGNALSFASSTSGGSSTITFLLQLSAYLKAALVSLNGATSSAQTLVAGTGTSVTTVAGASNSTTTVTNTGVTSFTGAGCVTAANSTGTVSLAVSCISGNQNITFTLNGDATGTASGATAITDSITVTGLNGKALPANTTGTLQYSQGAWAINLATSSLGVYDANGKLSSYIGSSCGGGQFVTGFSATGTVACGTPPAAATYTVAAGTGTSVSTATSGGNTTSTVTNTGVTSFNGATGTISYAPSTTIPTTYVTTFNGSSGVVTYAPSTTIPTNNNQLTNGAGYITTSTGLTVANLATSSISQFVNDSHFVTSTGGGVATTTPFTNGNPVIASGAGISTITTSTLLSELGAVTSTGSSGTGTLVYYVAASNAPAYEKIMANAICPGTDDGPCINTALNVVSSSALGYGNVALSDGTFNVSTTIAWNKSGLGLIGNNVFSTTINCSGTNTYCVHVGQNQATGNDIQYNFENLTINGNTTTTTDVWFDGIGQGSNIDNIVTNEGKYAGIFEDADRPSPVVNFRSYSAWTAGIDLRVGRGNSAGKIAFQGGEVDIPTGDTTGTAVMFDVDSDQGSPVPTEVVQFTGGFHMQESSGVSSGTCMDFVGIGARALSIDNTAFEDCNNQIETNGNEVDGEISTTHFLNTITTSTNILDVEGPSNLTLNSNLFQDATNIINGGSGYPNIDITGSNKNNGDVKNVFTGGLTLYGDDVEFAGAGQLSAGFPSQPLENIYTQNEQIMGGNLTPSSSYTSNLGSSGDIWNNIYTNNISATGAANLPNTTVNGNLTVATSSIAGNSLVATNAAGQFIATGTPSGSGGVSTSTTNTFSVPQNFNGISNTGNVTSTSFTASSTTTSSIANINGTFNIPANYATAGCPWGTADTDLGKCILDAYNSVSSTASSTVINVPILPPFTTFSTAINFNRNQEFVTLNCAPGQILQYTGATTATSGIVTYNEGQSTVNNIKISHVGGNNCHFAGGSSPPTTATTTAVYIGGTNGEAGLTLNNFGGIYAGTGLVEASNTYMATTNSFVSDEDVQAYTVATGSNSGETLVNYSFHALDTASTSIISKCVQTATNAFTELDFYGPSFDDCGVTVGPTTGSLVISGVNAENPAALSNLNYPAYPWLTLQSSNALTANITGGTIALDANSATSSPTSTIVDNAILTITNVAVARNGNQTATNLVDISGNPSQAQFTEQGMTFQASAVTNMVSSTNYVVATSSYWTNAMANTSLIIGTSSPSTANAGQANTSTLYLVAPSSSTVPLYVYSNNCTTGGQDWVYMRDQFGDQFQVGNCGALQDSAAGIGGSQGANGNVAGLILNTSNAGSDSLNTGSNVYLGSTSATTSKQLYVGASSTIQLGTSATAWTGCIEMYDAHNTSNLEYIYSTSSILVATTTKPAWCQ